MNNYLYHQSELDYLRAFSHNTSTGTFSRTSIPASDARISPMGDYMLGRESLSVNGSATTSAVLWLRQQTRGDSNAGCEVPRQPEIDRLTAYNAVPQNGKLQCLQSVTVPDYRSAVPPTVAGGKVFLPIWVNQSVDMIRVFKLGTSAPGNRDCPTNPVPAPPLCKGLVFEGQEARGFSGTGDWAKWPNYVHKASGGSQPGRHGALLYENT